jgi:hypothetical protein
LTVFATARYRVEMIFGTMVTQPPKEKWRMWIHEGELSTIGFRRKGERYWRCERRHGLTGHDHVSVFCWSEQCLSDGTHLVALTEFHVTFYRAGERLHFYYHERSENHWRHEGNTSHNEIRRLGLAPAELRAEADSVARDLIAELNGTLEEDINHG